MKLIKTLFIILLIKTNIFAQTKDTINDIAVQSYKISENETLIYPKPRWKDMIVKIPNDVYGTVKDIGKKNNAIAMGSAIALTLALIPNDQRLVDQSRILGERIGLKEVAYYNDWGPFNNIPPNITSGIYLLGNGTTPIVLSVGFATFGLIKNDYRALHTASGLLESVAVSGVFSQTIKRITGRQSPAPAMADGNPGGAWNPFPSFAAYGKNTPNYDAFPSGHLMTATSALYVIAGNYPEVKWIKPVGFVIIGALGFQMAQSYVHWYSDYPISLVLGYLIGKNIVKNRLVTKNDGAKEPKKYSIQFDASRMYGYQMAGVKVVF